MSDQILPKKSLMETDCSCIKIHITRYLTLPELYIPALRAFNYIQKQVLKTVLFS